MGEFDLAVVTRRLTMMSELLHDLRHDFFADPSVLHEDTTTRYAVERILTLLVDLAVGINAHFLATRLGLSPDTARDSFTMLAAHNVLERELADRLAPSVGLRNLLIHQYVDVDLELVARAVGHARRDYRDYIQALAHAIDES